MKEYIKTNSRNNEAIQRIKSKMIKEKEHKAKNKDMEKEFTHNLEQLAKLHTEQGVKYLQCSGSFSR